ncbi:MAG: TIGR02281 family clan AA aspartic protease [Pseudomonadota bacterium]|nr:TIGR02281 family clan AA aspartic protease [Pseudomonadota bacterium]
MIARRLPLGRVAMMTAAWIVIFLFALVAIALVRRNDWIIADTHELFYGRDKAVSGQDVWIPMADDGHFWAKVSINGVDRRLLIDSGATDTALSVDTARVAHIAIDDSRTIQMIDTSNGQIMARPVTIESLRVGSISTGNLPAVVAGAFGDSDVLGMSFLSRLRSWRVEGKTLIPIPN